MHRQSGKVSCAILPMADTGQTTTMLIPTFVLSQLFSQVVVLKTKPTQKVGIKISDEIEVITDISSIWQFP